jgi:hypothetical protein
MEVTMRIVERIACLAILALAGTACGAASGSSARVAEVSRYSCNLDEMMAAAEQAVTKEFEKVESSDKAQALVVSQPRWYSKEGTARRLGVSSTELKEGDIAFAVRVRIIDLKPKYQIQLDAFVQQFVAGSPKPRDLAEDDPQRPAWIKARLDKAAADMHGRLESCAELIREPH